MFPVVCRYPIEGYRPLQDPPTLDLIRAQQLFTYMERLLPNMLVQDKVRPDLNPYWTRRRKCKQVKPGTPLTDPGIGPGEASSGFDPRGGAEHNICSK